MEIRLWALSKLDKRSYFTMTMYLIAKVDWKYQIVDADCSFRHLRS